MALTGLTIVTEAAEELGVVGQGAALPSSVAATLLSRLNRLIDDLNAEREAVYATDFLTFTFTPGLNPHLIGPSGTWVVAQRPVMIEGATVVLTPGPNQVNAPAIRLHDQSSGFPLWNQSIAMPKIQTSYPTDGYYDATWPNGSFYLWPVPGIAYQCQIQTRAVLASYDFSTTFSMPPGYHSALMLTVAEESADALGRQMSATLPARALAARARVFSNNTGAGPLRTQDAGMPRQRGVRSSWNWLVGTTK